MGECCATLEQFFDRDVAESDLRRYRRRGPIASTRRLIAALRAAGARGRLLDIGGGIGAIQVALLHDRVTEAEGVDASRAFSEAAAQLAAEHGVRDRLHQQIGDFVEIADRVESADVVTLDRVICCYPDWRQLVTLSAERARVLYAFTIPRRRWSVRVVVAITNTLRGLRNSQFRVYVWDPDEIVATLNTLGMTRRSRDRTLIWDIQVFERTA